MCDAKLAVHRRRVLATISHACGPRPGIGKSLAQRLAQQGLNVVLVALDVRDREGGNFPFAVPVLTRSAWRAAPQQPELGQAVAELKAAFPKQQFRQVCGPCSALLSLLLCDVPCASRPGWRGPEHARGVHGRHHGGDEGH